MKPDKHKLKATRNWRRKNEVKDTTIMAHKDVNVQVLGDESFVNDKNDYDYETEHLLKLIELSDGF